MSTLLRTALVTTCGLGFLRPAPGTWGSLPPPAIVFALALLDAPPIARDAALIALIIIFSAACLALGPWSERRFGRKDPSNVVADETAGQSVALLLLPASALDSPLRAMLTLGAGFLLFRAFDIWKPPPARGLQRLPAGQGILIDDLLAGLYAALILQLLARFALPALPL